MTQPASGKLFELLKEDFYRTWDALHCYGEPFFTFNALYGSYDGQRRHYHNLEHVWHILTELDEVKDLLEKPLLVRLAVPCHDSIYNIGEHDNEERSAEFSFHTLESSGIGHSDRRYVHDLVLTTKDHAAKGWKDAEYLIDADMCIIGQPVGIFDKYELNIWEEAKHIMPFNVWRPKREEFMKALAGREQFFFTEHFKNKYADQAKLNIVRSIERLGDAAKYEPFFLQKAA